jgi:hypothetical protein
VVAATTLVSDVLTHTTEPAATGLKGSLGSSSVLCTVYVADPETLHWREMFDGAKSSKRTQRDEAVFVMPTVMAATAFPEIVTLVTELKYALVVTVAVLGPVMVSEIASLFGPVPVTTNVFTLSLPAEVIVT